MVAGGINWYGGVSKGTIFGILSYETYLQRSARGMGFFVSCIAVAGGFAGVLLPIVLLPEIAADSLLSRWGYFQKARGGIP